MQDKQTYEKMSDLIMIQGNANEDEPFPSSKYEKSRSLTIPSIGKHVDQQGLLYSDNDSIN